MHDIYRVHATAPPAVDSSSEGATLEVVVMFTGVKETLAALRSAASLAQGLSARIRLVVPQPVPFPAELDQPPVGREFTERRFLTLAEQSGVDTHVDIRICRDWQAGAMHNLKPGVTVVIGVRWPRWWPRRRERKLAQALRARGHHVLLVDVKPETRHA
jgi:hypothetical protein